MAKGRLYIGTGRNEVIAINAESGRSLWRYDARPDATGVPVATCRGVAYYKVPDAAGLCAERIITATIDARLLALDAITGRPFPGFRHTGAVDLRGDLGRVGTGYFFVTLGPQTKP